MSQVFQIKVVFKGLVQGVFFLHHVKLYADELQIKGYVKNKDNGAVELVALGSKDHLDQLLKKIQRKPGNGKIDAFEVIYENPQDFSSFQIIR